MSVIGDILPSAFGIVLTPTHIAAVILILFTDKAKRNGLVV